jgi:pyruvate/2-oxoglutarate dehydrogenase complex dihydrolipoamide acyltransferase (E2) component
VEGLVEPREILNLTAMFYHEVIDGALAMRFTRTLVKLIESAYGLQRIRL